MNKIKVSDLDNHHLKMIRENIDSLTLDFSKKFDDYNVSILDVAPQIYQGVKKHFKLANIKTLDIDNKSNADYICDLGNATIIDDSVFDLVFCTEVLEHTNDPFSCVNTIKRILKPKGIAVITTPFNFRIHNPLPDNWRFTEHGLKILFKEFSSVEIKALETNDRPLMPIQYSLIAIK